MSEEFNMLKALQKKYPTLFEIYARCQGHWISVAKGWYDLIDRCCAEVLANDPTAQVVQIKEKFGGLRFYLNTNEQTRASLDIISKYESESMETCEICGKPGKTRNYTKHYIRTVCDDCQKERDEKKD